MDKKTLKSYLGIIGNTRNKKVYKLNTKISMIIGVCMMLLVVLFVDIGRVVYNIGIEQQYILTYMGIGDNISNKLRYKVQEYIKSGKKKAIKNELEGMVKDSIMLLQPDIEESYIIEFSRDNSSAGILIGNGGLEVKEEDSVKISSKLNFSTSKNDVYSIYNFLTDDNGKKYYYCMNIDSSKVKIYNSYFTVTTGLIAFGLSLFILIVMILIIYRSIQKPMDKLSEEIGDLAIKVKTDPKVLWGYQADKLIGNITCKEIEQVSYAVSDMVKQISVSAYKEEYLKDVSDKYKNEVDEISNNMAFTKKLNNFQSIVLNRLRAYDDTYNLLKIIVTFIECDALMLLVQNNAELAVYVFNRENEAYSSESIDEDINDEIINSKDKWGIHREIMFKELPDKIKRIASRKFGKKFTSSDICSGKINGNVYSLVFLDIGDTDGGIGKENLSRLIQISKLAVENVLLHRKLAYDSEHDTMTHLFNKDKYIDMVEHGYRGMVSIGIMYLDVNNLKQVNDTQGHEFGDKLIKKAAASIRSILDSNTDGYRVGGDEFVVVITNCTDKVLKQKVAKWEHTLDTLNKQDKTTKCNIAIGVSIQEGLVVNIESLIAEADKNMYENKKIGKYTDDKSKDK